MNSAAKFKKYPSFVIPALLLLSSLLLTACGGGGGGGSAPVALPDQDASGLFKSGTAELNSGATMLSDLRAFVYQGRIMMFSVAGHILYDGQINTITSDDYTATVDVYELGVKTQSAVSVTGKVTSQSQITGTVAGTASYSGTFTLTFDPAYNRAATFARIDTDLSEYAGNVYNSMPGVGTNNFGFTSTQYGLQTFTSSTDRCNSAGTYTMASSINIYQLNQTIAQRDPACTMSISPVYTGFASAIDGSSVDDTLLYAVANGTNAQFAIVVK